MHGLISREVDLRDIETEMTNYEGHMITEFDLAPAVLRRGVRVR